MRLVSLVIGVALAGPAIAQPLKAVPVQLDPAKAYVLVELVGTKPVSSVTLARYDMAVHDVRGGAQGANDRPSKAQGVREVVGKAPIAKSETSRLYLVALEPDTWVVEGAGGTAFSLGSVTATLDAGTITDLGVLTIAPDLADGQKPDRVTVGKLAMIGLLGPFAKRPDPVPSRVDWRPRELTDLAVPVPLPGQVRPVTWMQGAKFGNYLGGLVNRFGGRATRPGVPIDPAPAAVPK